jgi:hypothetical protein
MVETSTPPGVSGETIADPLPGLQEQLASEYGEIVPREMIDRAAEEALEELHEARIREFVPVFAWRRARDRLRLNP